MLNKNFVCKFPLNDDDGYNNNWISMRANALFMDGNK